MLKMWGVVIPALYLAGMAGGDTVVRGAEQGNSATPDAGSEASQTNSRPTPRGKTTPERPKVEVEPVEVRREYRLSLGPWSTRLSLPETVDLLDLADRARGLVGMMAILGVAFYLSENRRAISRRVVSGAFCCNGASPCWSCAFQPACDAAQAGDGVEAMLDCALAGAEFVFGKGLVDPGTVPQGSFLRFACCPRSSSSRRCSPCSITWA